MGQHRNKLFQDVPFYARLRRPWGFAEVSTYEGLLFCLVKHPGPKRPADDRPCGGFTYSEASYAEVMVISRNFHSPGPGSRVPYNSCLLTGALRRTTPPLICINTTCITGSLGACIIVAHDVAPIHKHNLFGGNEPDSFDNDRDQFQTDKRGKTCG